jgi:hypothetical protein
LAELALGVLCSGRDAGVYSEGSGHGWISLRLVYQGRGFWVGFGSSSFLIAIALRTVNMVYFFVTTIYQLPPWEGGRSDRAPTLG